MAIAARFITALVLSGFLVWPAAANDLRHCQEMGRDGWLTACERAAKNPKLTPKQRSIVLAMQGAAASLHSDSAENIAQSEAFLLQALKLDQQNGIAHLLYGGILSVRKQYDVALQHLQTARQIMGKRQGVANAFGIHYREKGDLALALKEFDAELKSHPRNTASRVERAWAHHLNNDKAKALKDLDQAIRELGNNTGAVSRYMPLFKDIGAPEAALPHLDRLLQKPETRTAELFLMRAHLQLARQNYAKARDDFTESLLINGNNAEAFIDRARAHGLLKDYKSAFFDLSQAEILSPQTARIHAARGWLNKEQTGCKAALPEFNKSLSIDPKSAWTLFEAAWCEDELRNYANAVSRLTAAIEINPNNAVYFNNRGWAHESLDQADLAIRDYSRAITLDPQYHRAYRNRSNAYATKFERDRDPAWIEKGKADIEQAMKIAPDNLDVLNSWASFHRRTGRCDLAIPAYEKIIAKDAKHFNALSNLGHCHNIAHDWQNAVRILEQALTIRPKHARNLNNMAWAKYHLGRLDEAMAEVEQSLALEQNNLAALDTRAHVRLAMGDRIGAIDDFQQVVLLGAKKPHDSAVKLSRQRLEELGALPPQ